MPAVFCVLDSNSALHRFSSWGSVPAQSFYWGPVETFLEWTGSVPPQPYWFRDDCSERQPQPVDLVKWACSRSAPRCIGMTCWSTATTFVATAPGGPGEGLETLGTYGMKSGRQLTLDPAINRDTVGNKDTVDKS